MEFTWEGMIPLQTWGTLELQCGVVQVQKLTDKFVADIDSLGDAKEEGAQQTSCVSNHGARHTSAYILFPVLDLSPACTAIHVLQYRAPFTWRVGL